MNVCRKRYLVLAAVLWCWISSPGWSETQQAANVPEEPPVPGIVERKIQAEMLDVAYPDDRDISPVESGHDTACFHTEEVRSIQIEVNKSIVVDADTPITRVAVGNPNLADVTLLTEQQVLLVASNNVGATNLIFWHGDTIISVYEIIVMIPGSQVEIIQNALRMILPEADKIRVYVSGRSLVLDGQVDSQELLDDLLQMARSFVPNVVNLVRVSGCQQVQLEVTIVEVMRSAMKQMGLSYLSNNDWGIGLLPSGTVTGGLATTGARSDLNSALGRFSGDVGASGGATSSGGIFGSVSALAGAEQTLEKGYENGLASALSTEASLSSPYASAFKVLLQSSSGDSLTVLNLLKGQNLARTLANPTLVALSGQEASFLVGGEFPIPVNTENGSGISVSYHSYGIMLRFMPTVISRDTITLQVAPEVSSPDYTLGVVSASVSVPGVRMRRGETTLQLRDGQTFVMAGLLTDNMSQVINKVPFVGDIPILGSLFTSKEYQRDESELVIVVRAHLVRPLAPSEVPPLPGAEIVHEMTDSAFFLNTVSPHRNSSSKTDRPVFSGTRGFAH